MYVLALLAAAVLNAAAVFSRIHSGAVGGRPDAYATFLAPPLLALILLDLWWLLSGRPLRPAEWGGAGVLALLAVAQVVMMSALPPLASAPPGAGPYLAMLTAVGVAFLSLPNRAAASLSALLGALCMTLPWVLGGLLGRGPAHAEPVTLLRMQLSVAGVALLFWGLAWFRSQHATQAATEAALRHLAFTDALTGLPNRRAMYGRVDAVIGGAARGEGGALLLLDVDHFKRVNDRHGHAAGDEVLVAVGELLGSLPQPTGGPWLGRWGGEEFIVALPGCSLDAARAEAEKVRRAFHERAWPHGLSITVSVGVEVARPGDNAASLLARADQALYHAKHAGRDRVAEFEEELLPVLPESAPEARPPESPAPDTPAPATPAPAT